MARITCLKYGLPDPLQYLEHPWRPDRWRDNCKLTVRYYWENEFLKVVQASDTLKYVDTEYASVSVPMRVWQMAGLCSKSVRQATVQNWMILGVYYTRIFVQTMKKVKSLGVLQEIGRPEPLYSSLWVFQYHQRKIPPSVHNPE